MEENRDLLKITREEEGISVHWNVHGADEMMGICVALTSCARRNEAFLFMLLGTIKQAFSDEEFAKELDGNCFEMPDFDAILKNDE